MLLPLRLKKTEATRSRSRPARSRASTVLAKRAGSVLPANGGDLGIVGVECGFEGGEVMFRPDPLEGRKAERRVPYGLGERSDVPGLGGGCARHGRPSVSSGPMRGNLVIPASERKESRRHFRHGVTRVFNEGASRPWALAPKLRPTQVAPRHGTPDPNHLRFPPFRRTRAGGGRLPGRRHRRGHGTEPFGRSRSGRRH